jgi:predicted RNase H-like nuclease (RuvC/YqgF family)
MYRNNDSTISNLKENLNFLNHRIDEIQDFINKMESQNQTVSPVTSSILELNREMRLNLQNEINKLDKQ